MYRTIWNRWRRDVFLAAASASILMAVIFSVISLRKSEEALSASIAPKILRFHVLANSDSAEDQSLKLEVKQMLIDTMYEEMAENTKEPLSKDVMSSFVLTHREELEEKAERYMAKRGFPYPASIRLERCYFPTKIYGDVVFPCGTYDAVRVLLGSGEGKNWWCVLYPPLCFTDNAYGEVPDSSKKELENLLDDSDYYALMRERRVVFGDIPGNTDYGNTVLGNAVPGNAANENTSLENTANENTSLENTANENTSLENAANENTSLENTANETAATTTQVTVRVKLRFPQLWGRSNQEADKSVHIHR